MVTTSHPTAAPGRGIGHVAEPDDPSAARVRTAALDPRIARSRSRVLAAATDLLIEEGAGAVTVDAVVERSGVAKSTLYRHWSSVTQLLVDVLRANVPHPTPPEPGQTFEEALRAAVRSVAISVSGPEWIHVIPAIVALRREIPELGDLLAADHAAKRAVIGGILDLGVGEGVLPRGIDVDRAAHLLLGPVVVAALTGDTAEVVALADDSVDAFIALHRSRSRSR